MEKRVLVFRDYALHQERNTPRSKWKAVWASRPDGDSVIKAQSAGITVIRINAYRFDADGKPVKRNK